MVPTDLLSPAPGAAAGGLGADDAYRTQHLLPGGAADRDATSADDLALFIRR